MSQPLFRIHPSIGFARVGESDEYYLQPETSPGTLDGDLAGGIPLQAGSRDPEKDPPIQDADLRDAKGDMKRQAARFKIFQYAESSGTYPEKDPGTQITIGSKLPDGRTVTDIVWTVHLANKKANWLEVNDFVGIDVYNSQPSARVFDGKDQQLVTRNPGNPADSPPQTFGDIGYLKLTGDVTYLSTQRTKWAIDAGPRAVHGRSAAPVPFGPASTPSRGDGASIAPVGDYPVSFPSMHFEERESPLGEIDTLGDLATDAFGRLLVLPAFGRTTAVNGRDLHDLSFVENSDMFDDTADGPVNATLVLDDGSIEEVVGGWVVATDPAYAPQVRNAVTLWDDAYDTFVRDLALEPTLFAGGKYQDDFAPGFDLDVSPFFKAAGLQRWIANLPPRGVMAHDSVRDITAETPSSETELFGLEIIRDPDKADHTGQMEQKTMPLSLGDAGMSFMAPSPTQYFFLKQWDTGHIKATRAPLGPGEKLDRAALENCLGGRFSPGIDVTFIIRDVNLYVQTWQDGAGPFRVDAQPLDYSKASKAEPFLGVGYVPLQPTYGKVEPGDLCKFMAIPWHTDYNSCATHLPEPNPKQNNVLYWSWPAQRPVAVHVASDVKDTGAPPDQRFSVRGTGTVVGVATDQDGAPIYDRTGRQIREVWNEGRYQDAFDMLLNFGKIGTVLQASQIPHLPKGTPSDWFLEVQSKLTGPEDEVQAWPNPTVPPSAVKDAELS